MTMVERTRLTAHGSSSLQAKILEAKLGHAEWRVTTVSKLDKEEHVVMVMVPATGVEKLYHRSRLCVLGVAVRLHSTGLKPREGVAVDVSPM